MLNFYALPVSTYCTKVRIVLRLKGIEFEEHPPLGGNYANEEWRAFMPPGSIPAIEHDGFKLFDSEAIVEYLDELVPEPPMRSTDLQIRARQRAFAQFHNTRLEPVVRKLFPLVKAHSNSSADDQPAQLQSEFSTQLVSLCKATDFDPYIGGSEITLADCGYPATIRMGQDILTGLAASVTLPGEVTRWLAALEQNPVIANEVAKNRQAVSQWLGQFL